MGKGKRIRKQQNAKRRFKAGLDGMIKMAYAIGNLSEQYRILIETVRKLKKCSGNCHPQFAMVREKGPELIIVPTKKDAEAVHDSMAPKAPIKINVGPITCSSNVDWRALSDAVRGAVLSRAGDTDGK